MAPKITMGSMNSWTIVIEKWDAQRKKNISIVFNMGLPSIGLPALDSMCYKGDFKGASKFDL